MDRLNADPKYVARKKAQDEAIQDRAEKHRADGERVAVELSAESARALIRKIESALASGEAEHKRLQTT